MEIVTCTLVMVMVLLTMGLPLDAVVLNVTLGGV